MNSTICLLNPCQFSDFLSMIVFTVNSSSDKSSPHSFFKALIKYTLYSISIVITPSVKTTSFGHGHVK